MSNNEIIFTDEFISIPLTDIKKKIIDDGYFYFEKALSDRFIREIENEISVYRFSMNENKPTGTFTIGQYFFVDLLKISKSFYKYVTSQFVGNLCGSYFGENFRLKALRYYETFGNFHMQWHTDNKTDREFAEIPGLIFIFYVSDVDDGEFQYVEGSHRWSNHKAYNDFSDEFIRQQYSNDIRSFKGSKGSLIIYNTYGVHRAKPSRNSSLVRKSVFFQVDGDVGNSEPIYLNTPYHTNKQPWVEQFLGFGLNQSYKPFPSSNVASLPISIMRKSLSLVFNGMIINLLKRNKLTRKFSKRFKSLIFSFLKK